MTDVPITFRSDMDVNLIDHMGNDERVIRAAKVSTTGSNAISLEGLDEDVKVALDDVDEMTEDQRYRFIRFLLLNRHGSPFEHVVFTFFVSAPIFVFREFMRHRMASYNEESGRYKVLEPVFYIPSRERKLQQVGKTGEYRFEDGTDEQHEIIESSFREDCERVYESYLRRLDAGIAKEVSRMTLPLNLYSSMFVTMNSRSMMNFLSLRTSDEGMFPSFPQREIEMVAEKIEVALRETAPLTYRAFQEAQRVSP